MREIKFRGKRKNGEWVYGDLLQPGYIVSKDCVESIISKNNDRVSIGLDTYLVLPETVGQYIGLKDKNGKEIYEGDIMMIPIHIEVEEGQEFSYYEKSDNGFIKRICLKPKQCVVVKIKSQYVFKHIESEKTKPFWVCETDIETKYEIIGNIHDSKE